MPARLTFEPLPGEEFHAYQTQSSEEYAQEISRARDVPLEEAQNMAKDQLATLLPQGRETPGHHFFALKDREAVGHLWVQLRGKLKKSVFIYDVSLFPRERGKGYGRAALIELDRWARQQGAAHIELHVFASNSVAQALYRSHGFEVTSFNMRKNL